MSFKIITMNIENTNVIPIVHNEASGNNIINLNPSILNKPL